MYVYREAEESKQGWEEWILGHGISWGIEISWSTEKKSNFQGWSKGVTQFCLVQNFQG